MNIFYVSRGTDVYSRVIVKSNLLPVFLLSKVVHGYFLHASSD